MIAVLHKARYYLVKGSYSRAYKILLPQAPRFKKHYEYLYLMGIATFGMGNIDAAYEYFNTAVGIASTAQAQDATLYLAIIALASRNVRKAVEYWLNISNESSNNPYAMRGLKYLQHLNDNGHERIAEMARNPYKYKLVPQLKYPFQKLYKSLKISALCIGVGLFSYSVYWGITKSFDWYKKRNTISERKAVVSNMVARARSKTEATIQADTYPRYVVLSPNTIRNVFANMERHFILYQDNRTQVNINTILYSNALAADKNKALLLEGYLRPLDFSAEVVWFSYQQVQAEPWQYDKTTVRWKGTITKVATHREAREGSFLVGFYGNNKNLEGVVLVDIPHFIEVNTGDEIEMLGTIMLDPFDSTAQEDAQNFSVNARAIRYLRAGER